MLKFIGAICLLVLIAATLPWSLFVVGIFIILGLPLWIIGKGLGWAIRSDRQHRHDQALVAQIIAATAPHVAVKNDPIPWKWIGFIAVAVLVFFWILVKMYQ